MSGKLWAPRAPFRCACVRACGCACVRACGCACVHYACPCVPMRARGCPWVPMRAHACPCVPMRGRVRHRMTHTDACSICSCQ